MDNHHVRLEELVITDDGIRLERLAARLILADLDVQHEKSRVYDEESNLLLDGLRRDIDAALEDEEQTDSDYIRLERDDVFDLIDYFSSKAIGSVAVNSPNNKYWGYLDRLRPLTSWDTGE